MKPPQAPHESASEGSVSPWASLRQTFLSHAARSVLIALCLSAAADLSPKGVFGLRVFRSPDAEAGPAPSSLGSEAALGTGEATLAEETSTAEAPQDTSPSKKSSLFGGQRLEDKVPPSDLSSSDEFLFDPSGTSLDLFFSALRNTENKEGITRIAHYGDSIVVSDYVSATLRRKLQTDFGDAGHGFMLIANAWPAYFHNHVFRFATSGFKVSRIVGPLAADGLYGLGGVSFRGGPGVVAQFGTADSGDFGRSVSRFVLSYLAFPKGGTILLDVDGKRHTELSTSSEVTEAKHLELDLEDAAHRFEMKVRGGETRTFGVILERKVPGVVLDALGVQGARIRFLDKQDDSHFQSELSYRNPNLIVFQFGANESGDGYAVPMQEYQSTMQAVIVQAKKAVPSASCLIIGAMDRARVEDGNVTSMRIITLLVEEQRKAAEALGCAYFDTYRKMGGFGSMPAWIKRGLGQADMTHPTGVGAERIGGWIYEALMRRYRAKYPG